MFSKNLMINFKINLLHGMVNEHGKDFITLNLFENYINFINLIFLKGIAWFVCGQLSRFKGYSTIGQISNNPYCCYT